MSIGWTASEKTLLEVVRTTLSTREIKWLLQLLGFDRTTDAIQKQSKKLGLSFKDFGTPSTHQLTEKEVAALQVVLADRKTNLSNIQPFHIKSPWIKGSITSEKNKISQEMLDQLQEIRKALPRTGSLSTAKVSSTNESLVLVLSDWHMGEIVYDPETGEEIFNMEIALERISRTPALITAGVGIERLENIDECVVLLIGDMVTGEGIFPHQEMSLEEHAAEQVLQVSKALWALLQQLRSTFPLVRVITTKGNHGRTAHSPEANWDNIVYQQLELLVDLDGGKDITIKNRYADFNTCDVKGWKGLVRHQAPIQADTAGGVVKFAGWQGIHEWDWMCYGHYHHWGAFTYQGKPILRNGSLVGMDEYAENLARSDAPVQLCFGISEEKPLTFICPLMY